MVEPVLTGIWLAEQIGKSENIASKWRSNKIQPSLEPLFEVVQVLDVDMRLLIVSTKQTVGS